jgi:hypothetical protein
MEEDVIQKLYYSMISVVILLLISMQCSRRETKSLMNQRDINLFVLGIYWCQEELNRKEVEDHTLSAKPKKNTHVLFVL